MRHDTNDARLAEGKRLRAIRPTRQGGTLPDLDPRDPDWGSSPSTPPEIYGHRLSARRSVRLSRRLDCQGLNKGGSAPTGATADNPPGEQIDDDGNVKPAFCRPNICEVRNPFAVGSRRLEGAIEHVRSDGSRRPLTSGGRRRRRGRALRAWSSINRSIRCRPHDMPSVSRSCQTSLAP